MHTHTARLLFALVAFAVGCAASAAAGLFRAPRVSEARVPTEAPAPSFRLCEPLNIPRPPATPQPAATPRVTQEMVVAFPRAGRVLVRAVENFGETLRLEFLGHETDVRLAAFPVGPPGDSSFRPSPDLDPKFPGPFLRFEVLRTDGLPQPLVLAVAVTPGGSGHGLYAHIFGEAGGKLTQLTPEPLSTSNIGGVFVGDLGRGRGFGAAVWDFIWDTGSEGHYSAHRYEVEQFTFDRRRQLFVRARTLRSRFKYGSHGTGALAELGLDYANLLHDIGDVSVFNQP